MNLKGTGIVPFFAIFFLFSLAPGLKLEVEVITPITKARSFPSSSSDPKGLVRKGQTFIVDVQSGEWYRINISNSFVWIPKDAVKVLRSDPDPPPRPATASAEGKPPASGNPQGKTSPPPSAATGEKLLQRAGQISPAAQPSKTGENVAAAQKITPAETITPAEKLPPVVKNTPQRPEPVAPRAVVEAARPLPPPLPPKSRARLPKRTAAAKGPLDTSGRDIMYFQVSSKTVPIYAIRDDGRIVLTNAKKGEYFPIMERDSLWCRVAVNDTAGWVKVSGGKVVNAPESNILDEYLVILAIIAGAVMLLLVLGFIFFLRGRAKKKRPEASRFQGLIIAREAPAVQSVVLGKHIPLEKYLSSIGFSSTTAPTLARAQKAIDQRRLDAVFIDWHISDDIPGTVEILFAAIEQKRLPLAIFFNVPNTAEPPLIPVLLRAYHLGSAWVDQDIYNLLMPTMLSNTDRKPGADSALEGHIAEGNLPEIMEFIEIGKKTGALMVETESPIGVLYFAEGRVVSAIAVNGVSGRDAINILLNLKHGRFRFILGKQPKVKNLNLSTLEVLMEWTKAKDEAHRH